MKHRTVCLVALALTALMLWHAVGLSPTPEQLPGADAPPRRLLRIWVASSVGGGEGWLREALKAWEKANPGTMTFLRTVSAEEIARPDAVLPDVLLYTPGTISAPESLFAPMVNITGVREELLRAGRWQGQQYALPLCYAAYALAIDSALEPDLAATPAPTTLLGRPAATASPDATATPGIPAHAQVSAPKGCGLFTLRELLPPGAPLTSDFATTDTADIFQRFRSRKAGIALLTTGQITALQTAFPFRVITGTEVITDQVWLASLLPGCDASAAQLLSYLTSPSAQKLLPLQGLYTVREDLRLYATGMEAQVEAAASSSLTVPNVFLPPEEAASAAWRYFHGQLSLAQALTPLL